MFQAILELFRPVAKEDASAKEKLRHDGRREDEDPPTDLEHLKLWKAIYGVKNDISELKVEMQKEVHNNTKWIIQIMIGLSIATMGLVSAFGMAILGHFK